MILSAIMVYTGPLFWFHVFDATNRLGYTGPVGILTFRKPPDPFWFIQGSPLVLRGSPLSLLDRVLNLFRAKPLTNDYKVKQLRKQLRRVLRYRMTAMKASEQARQDTEPRVLTVDSDSIKIMVDNGSTVSVWQHQKSFVTYNALSGADLTELTNGEGIEGVGGNIVQPAGIGTIKFDIEDDLGTRHTFQVDKVLHVPSNPINLFSPQQWSQQRFRQLGDDIAHCDTRRNHLLMEWKGSNGSVCRKVIPLGPSNVGITHSAPAYTNFRSYAALFKAFNANYISDDDTVSASENSAINPSDPSEKAPDAAETLRQTPVTADFNPARQPSVISPEQDTDKPITVGDQRLKMEYHERLGHLSFDAIDRLSKQGVLPRRLSKCPTPKCPGCLYGKATRRPWRTRKQPKHIKCATAPGQVVSVDQLESPVPGFVPIAKGNPTSRRYIGATVFADHFSGLSYVHLMTSMNSEQTVEAKLAFERFAHKHGVTIKHYHCDNGRFADKVFLQSVEASHQTISFCGVSAHHQNGVAERRIRDLSESTRTMLLHASHRWPQAIVSNLWPQALKHAVNIRNAVPRGPNGISPLSAFCSSTVEPNLKHFHPFACPVYVLERPLQSGGMYPKWKERSRVGIYLGRSPNHASNVPLVLNTRTGLVSPQFHVVFDDNFDTVSRDKHFTSLWQQKARLQDAPIPDRTPVLPTATTVAPSSLPDYQHSTIPTAFHTPWDTPAQADNASLTAPSPADASGPSEMPQAEGESTPLTQRQQSQLPREQVTTDNPVAPAGFSSSGRTVRAPNRLTYAFVSVLTQGLTDLHPLAGLLSFAAPKRRDPDTMTLDQALREPDADQFIEAMDKELQDHISRGHWDLVHISQVPRHIKPINMVWSMKRKRDPAGDIIKWKARLCAHGGMQVYGDSYWDTYSPVVSWSTVRLVLILALVLGWEMKSIDFVLAYPQAEVKANIYMRLPKGTKVGRGGHYMLKLKRNLYGLKDAGLTWHEHIKKGLIDRGWQQSQVDPCLFVKGTILLTLYVDDAALFGPDNEAITSAIKSLEEDFLLTDEGDLKDYLGVRIERRPDGSALITQPRMVDRCLSIVGLPTSADTEAAPTKLHETPAVVRPVLHKDTNGPKGKRSWDYRAAIGALNYLLAMTRPDLAYAVHQCARYSNDPKLSHEQAVKRICRYLKGTEREGMILKPDLSQGFVCYADADWAGNWNKDYADDPSCAYSRTGYVIMYAGCPIVWASKVQSLIALSTTEAEYIALSTALREVISMMNLLEELQGLGVSIPFSKPVIKCQTFEDNSACIELAKEPKLRPRTKHLSVRLHHFRDYIVRGKITVEYVNTKAQIADLLTKALPAEQFKSLRKKLMGW